MEYRYEGTVLYLAACFVRTYRISDRIFIRQRHASYSCKSRMCNRNTNTFCSTDPRSMCHTFEVFCIISTSRCVTLHTRTERQRPRKRCPTCPLTDPGGRFRNLPCAHGQSKQDPLISYRETPETALLGPGPPHGAHPLVPEGRLIAQGK